MKTKVIIKSVVAGLIASFSLSVAFANTNLKEQHAGWTAQAKSADAVFVPSAERGKNFYGRIFRAGNEMASCASCHTANPKALGKHVITGKEIPALSPSANPERFTDTKKSEKWFKRNCNDVIGRECTAAEKSDLTAWLLLN
jgi:mono/diheme cytochrome c family protein